MFSNMNSANCPYSRSLIGFSRLAVSIWIVASTAELSSTAGPPQAKKTATHAAQQPQAPPVTRLLIF